MKLHNLRMEDPEWAAFVNSIVVASGKKRRSKPASQSKYFDYQKSFGGYPAHYFCTLAGGILQEMIMATGNDKVGVASRAGMSVTNLYAILNGNVDPKLGTLLRLAYNSGFYLRFSLERRPTR
jgi:hypothetical protein